MYVEETGSPYDPGSLTGSVESILFTPQDHDIPMQVRGILSKQILNYNHNPTVTVGPSPEHLLD